MFCANCGKPITSQTNFCPHCGLATAAATRAPSTSYPPSNSAIGTRALSAQHGILIGVALLLLSVPLELCFGTPVTVLVYLVVASTSLWAAIDSSRIRLREYQTLLASHPAVLFIAACLSWAVIFPWYLVVRSRIRARLLGRREPPEQIGLAVLGISLGVVVLVALMSTVYFRSRQEASVPVIWQAPTNQLSAAPARPTK